MMETSFVPLLQDLGAKPRASDIYLWCDYVELRCLASPDHRFSRGNLIEALTEGNEDSDAASDDDEDDEDADITDTLRAEAGAGSSMAIKVLDFHDSSSGDPFALPRDDVAEARAAEIFNGLASRAAIFKEHYPFKLDATNDELSLGDPDTPTCSLYLQLLLSSSLRLVPKTRRRELTDPFEAVAHEVFKCIMPAGWEVHRFGAKGAAPRYQGKLFNRLTTLASDINESLKVKARHFHNNNVGDGGLDLVAWHPLGSDLRIGLPIAFAQCGCAAEEWSLKTMECSPTRIGGYFNNVHHPWATYYFMPQDLYDASTDGPDWQQRIKLSSAIVVDRLRIVRLAAQYGVANSCLGAEEQIFEILTAGKLDLEPV